MAVTWWMPEVTASLMLLRSCSAKLAVRHGILAPAAAIPARTGPGEVAGPQGVVALAAMIILGGFSAREDVALPVFLE